LCGVNFKWFEKEQKMKIKITSCCSLPIDENGYLIEIPEEEVQTPHAKTCPTCGQKGKPVMGQL
jgi:hypothetical protein